jgi:hypothetical protein
VPTDYAAQKSIENFNKALEIDSFDDDVYKTEGYPVRKGQSSTGTGRNGKALNLKSED